MRVLGVVTVVSASVGIWAPINTTYRCMSPTTIRAGGAAVTFTAMRLEAYMPGNDLSPAGFISPSTIFYFVSIKTDHAFVFRFVTESVCVADQSTTVAPPTPAGTTVPTTTGAPPTPPGTPETGTFSVKNGSGTVCLLAKMGLQLNVSYISLSQNKVTMKLTHSRHHTAQYSKVDVFPLPDCSRIIQHEPQSDSSVRLMWRHHCYPSFNTTNHCTQLHLLHGNFYYFCKIFNHLCKYSNQ